MIRHWLAIVMLLGIVCSAGMARAADNSKPVKVFMYSEYIDPEMVKDFEKQTGMKYQIDTYENSEEMLAKMQQGGGVSQYDCIVVSDAHVPTLVKLGLVRELDAKKIPNAKNADPMFANPPFDPGAKFSVPYQWGTVGLIYDKKKVQGEISWDMIFNASKQPGPFVLMDSMRDMIGVGLRYKGFTMNSHKTEEIKQAMDALIQAKGSKKCLGLEGGVGGKNRVAAGEAALAVVYNGDAVKATMENPNLGFTVPKEGGIIWVDVMLVPAKAPNPEGGQAFINFIMDPKAGAQLSNFNRYPTPNKAAMPMINEEDRKNAAIYPPEETLKKLEYLVDVGADTRLYDEAWTAIRAQ
jgi:spermidine/putrescine transport system substrate-binding protein